MAAPTPQFGGWPQFGASSSATSPTAPVYPPFNPPQPQQQPLGGTPMTYTVSSPGFGVTSPVPSSSRKRHATGSPPDPSQFVGLPPDAKRRRPNLANGFSAMSISPRSRGASVGPDVFTPTTPGAQPGGTYPGASAAAGARLAAVAGSSYHDDLDDDSLEPTQPPLDRDVTVEELPHPHQRPAVPSPRLKRPRPWHRHSSFSSSTDPSEDDDYESDATFRIPSRPAPPVQASSVEHPDAALPMSDDGPSIEWIDTPSKRKQAAAEGERRSKRRREAAGPMAVDMDTLPPERYGEGWYEPEKDRIVVTSLSSPETSPTPPDLARIPPVNLDSERDDYSYENNRHLSQPGVQGFTISPSLLTHILNAQRNQTVPGPYSVQPERGLVLYRPLGIPAADHVVKEWTPQQHHLYPDPDGDRFEEVDDDEDLSSGPPIVGVPADGAYPFQEAQAQWGVPMHGMDCAMDDGGGWTGGDEAMDVE